jgi:hypothetical protein
MQSWDSPSIDNGPFPVLYQRCNARHRAPAEGVSIRLGRAKATGPWPRRVRLVRSGGELDQVP